ncbi:aldolase [Dehalogenimonas sp. THU2]|uniref:aldolase n=1 Tax=Dehalogenimonas sp. THU2 TaxID=3151121 RepID=UPI0032188FC2
MLVTQFKETGKALFTRSLVSSHSGNMSVRLGEGRMMITRRGSQLGALRDQDLITTGIEFDDDQTPLASVELPVHRAILKATGAGAVVHAHPPHAIALSMTETEIVSEQAELYELGKIPVLGWNQDVRPGCLGEVIAEGLKTQNIVLLYGHGTFAIGKDLEEAYKHTAGLEEACQVIWLVKTLRKAK